MVTVPLKILLTSSRWEEGCGREGKRHAEGKGGTETDLKASCTSLSHAAQGNTRQAVRAAPSPAYSASPHRAGKSPRQHSGVTAWSAGHDPRPPCRPTRPTPPPQAPSIDICPSPRLPTWACGGTALVAGGARPPSRGWERGTPPAKWPPPLPRTWGLCLPCVWGELRFPE